MQSEAVNTASLDKTNSKKLVLYFYGKNLLSDNHLTLLGVTMAIRCLGFEGRVGDAVFGKGMLEPFRHLWPTCEVVEDDMCRKCRFGGTDGPHMDMMHLFHMPVFSKQLLNLLQVHSVGDAIHCKSQAVGKQLPSGNEDDGSNAERHDGVDDGPAGVMDDDTADDHANGYQSVGGHVEEGATHVEVAFLAAHEEQCRRAIDEDAHACRPRHGNAIHFNRFAKLVDAFDHDGPDRHQKDDGIQERDEDGGLAVAVGETLISLYFGQPKCNQYQQQTEHIAEVVARITKEREGVLPKAHTRLNEHE